MKESNFHLFKCDSTLTFHFTQQRKACSRYRSPTSLSSARIADLSLWFPIWHRARLPSSIMPGKTLRPSPSIQHTQFEVSHYLCHRVVLVGLDGLQEIAVACKPLKCQVGERHLRNRINLRLDAPIVAHIRITVDSPSMISQIRSGWWPFEASGDYRSKERIWWTGRRTRAQASPKRHVPLEIGLGNFHPASRDIQQELVFYESSCCCATWYRSFTTSTRNLPSDPRGRRSACFCRWQVLRLDGQERR